MTCECVVCTTCEGSGNLWFTISGRYLGVHRSSDLDEMEPCDNCRGTGILEMCESCFDAIYEDEMP